MVRPYLFAGFLGLWVGALVACSSAGGAGAGVEGTPGGAGKSSSEGEGGSGSSSEGEGGNSSSEGGASSEGPGGNTSEGGGGSDTFGGGGGVIAAGGNGSSGSQNCAAVAQKADAKVLPADIVWVIDTSGSMSEEKASVQQKMNNFAQGILSVGIDVRVVLLAEEFHCDDPFWNCTSLIPPDGMCLPAPLGSGKCPGDANQPLYWHPNVTIGSTDGLLQIIDSYPTWKDALRQDSVKFIVAVTDDDATFGAYDPSTFPDGEKGSAAKFIQDFTALDPTKLTGFKMSGIYCFNKCPAAARQGKVWDELVNQTNGVKGDLCKQDFQPIFNDLAKGVQAAAKLDCAWKIPPPPQGQEFDPGLVNVKFTSGAGSEEDILFASSPDKCDPAKGGWYYDNPTSPTTVLACPSTCTKIQADNQGKIDVLFGCATRPVDIN